MMKIYGSKISYYTGKLEAYLRYKGVPYELFSPYPHQKAIRKHVGANQLPVVERSDGRWMSDTTPILLQLETEHPRPTVLPANPVVKFIALLMEDYADEWLWRSAMHYRWSYSHDRELLSSIIADEVLKELPLPRFMRRRVIQRRQLGGFVRGDGVRAETWDHVEAGYIAALDNMSTMLANRRFLLGDAPSLADFGFMAPMLRHFGHDPTPVDIMRNRAPAVYAWLGRVWNARPPGGGPDFVQQMPSDAVPMLREICETHLEQLAANVAAYADGPRRFAMTIQECGYVNMPVSRYRVACLERLRESFTNLLGSDQDSVRKLLPYSQAEILWSPTIAASSGYDEDREAPFGKAINVYAKGYPR
jgi:glutathione S-transferase